MLTSVAQIRALRSDLAAKGRPVNLKATLTYYEPQENLAFLEDATGAIFLYPPPNAPVLHAGDVVTVIGSTVLPGYQTNIRASELRFDHAGPFPTPRAASWREMMQGSDDCHYVSVRGTVRSASVQVSYAPATISEAHAAASNARADGRRYLLMDLQMDGGKIRVHIEGAGAVDPMALLDSTVQIDGAEGGIFDGNYQQTGVELWVSNPQHMKVLRSASTNPAQLPLTAIDQIMSRSFIQDQSQRVHVRGSLTLYEPGLQMVLQTPGGRAVLVNTFEQSPLHLGDLVDVVGFPDPHDSSEVLTDSSVLPTSQTQSVQPIPVGWSDTLAGHHPFVLVSMKGKVAAEVREPHQDTLVIEDGPHVFSAILPRTVLNQDVEESSLPDYPIGSAVRVTGVCFAHSGGPWNSQRWFDLELRSADDIAVLAAPPWWTARRLLYLSASLLALMMAAFFWALILQRKVRRQSEQIRLTMESEASRERRIAFLEKERGRVLEAINSMQNLDDVLLMILRLISTQLEGRLCWCELSNGTPVGQPGSADEAVEAVRRGIYSGAGERLGSLLVSGAEAYQETAGEALEMGASLAALAIDNRRLYETLIHRSQHDQLTNAANRFLLESRLDEALAHSGRTQSQFALIYIDLDQFKQVNDLHGHRVGDHYLQTVADRFSQSLRGMDTLARVGGDEFIALIPVVRNRAEVEEIIRRLLRSFEEPFCIEGSSIRGSASIGFAIYPEDGITKDDLKRVADTMMYANKPHAVI